MKPDIEYIVIDVDGVMTDAGIIYDDRGNELKKFCAKDGAGFFAAKAAGLNIIVLTGRESRVTERRMQEMKVELLFQNVKDKYTWLCSFMRENRISRERLGYIGDDLNDLPAMKLAGFIACPADSCPEVKACADYVSPVEGGRGVVRDVIEHMLRKSGAWEKIIEEIYGAGI